MKVKLPPKDKVLRGAMFPQVLRIDLNDFEVASLLPALFFKVLAQGRKRARRPNQGDPKIYIEKLSHHRDLIGFDDEDGQRLITRLTYTALITTNKIGRAKRGVRILNVVPYNLLAHKPGFPAESSRLRNVDTFLYHAMRDSLAGADSTLNRNFRDTLGLGLVIGQEPMFGGTYDGITKLDTLSRLSIAFLDTLEVSPSGQQLEERVPNAFPGMSRAVADDLLSYIFQYSRLMPAQAFTKSLETLICFELFVYSLKAAYATGDLVANPSHIPSAMDDGFSVSDPEIYVDFTGDRTGNSADMATGCLAHQVYGFAPSEIIYSIARNFVFGGFEGISDTHLQHKDLTETARRGGEMGMKFDVVVGNPPYQIEDGGAGTSAAPVYQLFVEYAKNLNPRYMSMITPSRWFSGGKSLDDFREVMLADDRLRSLDDYLSASDVFGGVGLKGGVCYFLWDRDNPGLCRVSTHFKDWPVSTAIRPLLEEGSDVFIRFNEGLSILKKVAATESDNHYSLSLPANKRFDQLVSSRKPFALETTFKGRKTERTDDLLVYQNGGTGYVARSEITTGKGLIDYWKVYVGRAAPGTGNRDTYPHRILSTPFLGEPGSICSETYLCIGPFNSKSEAESALSYLSCRLTRFLILLHKPSQDTTRKVYTFVPTQDWTRTWTDKDLYEKYAISESEIAFIEKVVRPMDLTGNMVDEATGEEDD